MAEHTNHRGQIDTLRSRLAGNIDSFRSKRDFNRKMAFILRMAISLIAALTTVVIGIKAYVHFSSSEEIFSVIALVLSAFVSVFAAWEAFFDHRWLWVRYTATLNSLYAIRDELEYVEAAGQITEPELDHLFARVQQTLQEVDREWSKKRGKELDTVAKVSA